GLQKAGADLPEASAGGLLGVKTELDPYLTKNDSLVGCIVGLAGQLPEPVTKIAFEVNMLERVVKPAPVKVGDKLLINIGTMRSVGEVAAAKKSRIEMNLSIPIVAEGRIAVSRLADGKWNLIGYGNL
ncbi:translation initiation factor IF-2 subunit gamma, partial [archaeon]